MRSPAPTKLETSKDPRVSKRLLRWARPYSSHEAYKSHRWSCWAPALNSAPKKEAADRRPQVFRCVHSPVRDL